MPRAAFTETATQRSFAPRVRRIDNHNGLVR